MTEKLNVFVLIGGISSNSLTKRLYNEVLKQKFSRFNFQEFNISDLPYFSQDIENNYPSSVAKLKGLVENADGILFITPEYNRSIPGVLKNAIDWGSRPWGNNSWKAKPIAIMGASTGAIGTFGAQQHLRNICSAVGMNAMSQPEFYFNSSILMPEQGLSEKGTEMVQKFFNSFESWIRNFLNHNS